MKQTRNAHKSFQVEKIGKNISFQMNALGIRW